MKSHRTDAVRTLPAPMGGMYRAKRPTGILMGLLVCFVAILLAGVPAIVSVVANGLSQGAATVDFGADIEITSLPGFLSFVVMAGVIVLWVTLKERRSLTSLGFAWRTGQANHSASGSLSEQRTRPPLAAMGWGALWALVMIAVGVLLPVMLGMARLTWQAPQLSATGLAIVAGMVFWFLVQGSAEEIFNRGFLTQVFARRWGMVAAVVVQAIVFALLHGGNPGMGVLPWVNLFLFAIFASMMTLENGSLWGICVFHGVWNWAQGNVWGIAVSGNVLDHSLFSFAANTGSNDLITGGAFGIEGSLIATLLYVGGAIILFLRYRRNTLQQPRMVSPAPAPAPANETPA